jgi:hypothetical protein
MNQYSDEIVDYVSMAESACKVRATLKMAFPKVKISVRCPGDIQIEWEDTGPTLEELQTALKTARLVEIHKAWNDREYLRDRKTRS